MDSGASWDPNRVPGVFRDPTNMDPIGNTLEQRPWTNRLPEPQNPAPEIQMNQNQNQIQGFTYSLDFTTHCAIDNWYKKYCGDDQAPELQNLPESRIDNNFLEAPQLLDLSEAQNNKVFEAPQQQTSQEPANALEVVIEEANCAICKTSDQVVSCYEVQMCERCSSRLQLFLEILQKGEKLWALCLSGECEKCQGCQLKTFLDAGVDLRKSSRFKGLVIDDKTFKIEINLTCLICSKSDDKQIAWYKRIGPVCHQCKCFFYRYRQDKITNATCKKGNCPLEYNRDDPYRLFCNFCRYKKCIEIGMGPKKEYPKRTKKSITPPAPVPTKVPEVPKNGDCAICGRSEAIECRTTMMEESRRVLTCLNCKRFFRRFSDFETRKTMGQTDCSFRNCKIEHNPKIMFQRHCNYCRFQKCLRVGLVMEKDPHKEPILDIPRNFGGNDYSNPGTSSNIPAAYVPPPIQNGPYFGFNYPNQYPNNYQPAYNFPGYDYNQFGPYYQYY